ncbi:NAD-dependent succinate-semialdehyde dehydrogenase [Pseudalkalibacillus hwajinpoensis]|uniref:NAD-dependent succinate-semialdehyde dehydrogenase n=1 Tax=Guptibacillus hwajinpoensis TaxID=208199 RepID=UPI00384CE92E
MINVDTTKGMFINGEWIQSESGSVVEVFNPATRDKITEIPSGGTKEAKLAIESAEKAFEPWAELTARERSTYLYKAYHLMIERKEKLAALLTEEQGKPLKEARGEIEFAASFLLWYAEEANRVYGEMIPSTKKNKRLWVVPKPIGVVAAITPWNFPAGMITRKVGPALAAGCTVVLKPAEQTPLTAIEIVKIFEEVGLPKGVLNIVVGNAAEIGKEIMDSSAVKLVTFTGSTEVGKLLMEGSAQTVKKLALELGGHAPLIVFEDADLDLAVDQAIASKYRNCGQTCICTNRLYVHSNVRDEFVTKLEAKVRELRVGNGSDESVDVGPLIDDGGLNKVKDQVEDALSKGAVLLTGGKQWEGPGGYFFEPTILSNVTDDMKIMTQETFGPVVPIQTFDRDEDAVAAANNTEYGLASFLFTNNLSRAIKVMEKLEYGIIGINDVFPGTAEAPFGGIKESGLGKEGGHEGIKEYLEMKYVSVALSDTL